MNYFGAFHTDVRLRALGICDAPCIAKGRMSLAASDTASDADLMTMCAGRLRNRSSLAKTLGCAPYASPAQLVLAAYRRWGEDYPLKLEGPTVSCVMDVAADRLLVSRDRMGECPLFYARVDDRLVFSDHPDTILKSAFIEPVLTARGARELFGLGPARTPGITPLEGLYMLEPGCVLTMSASGFAIRRYFALSVQAHEEALPATAAHVRELLEQAVAGIVHLRPACMLSGGLDSTALTALLSARIGRVDSFSVDYSGNAGDFVPNKFRPESDAPYVRLAVRAFGTRHRNVVLEQEILCDGIDKAVRLRGFPGMGDIDSSLMLLARAVARSSRAVVSGECGDEVFGGYPWFRGDIHMPDRRFPWSGSLELRQSILRREVREKLDIDAFVADTLHAAMERYDISGVRGERERTLFIIQRLCFDFFMPNLQERAVTMCETQGLGMLTPLCDDRLVRYVYNIPWDMKFTGGQEKGIFREAVRDLLPEKLLTRKKSPYPKTCSIAYSELMRKKIRDMLADASAPIRRLVDCERLEALLSSRLDPADTPWFGQLMAGPQLLAYLWQVNFWLKERGVAIEL